MLRSLPLPLLGSRWFLSCLVFGGLVFRLAAQTGPVVARAASVTGTAMVFTGSAGNSFGLSAGLVLNPGDRVDTRSGGRVVIDISDGSMVVVEPQSVVVLKDYRQAESLRELFEILLGKVRVKINHFGGHNNTRSFEIFDRRRLAFQYRNQDFEPPFKYRIEPSDCFLERVWRERSARPRRRRKPRRGHGPGGR